MIDTLSQKPLYPKANMNALLLEQITHMEASLAQMKRLLLSTATNTRVDHRHTAGKNEKGRIDELITHINTKTPVGTQIATVFQEHTGVELVNARERTGSNRSTHHDIVFLGSDEQEYKIEHKGSMSTKPITNPCNAGVQILNGPGEWFSVCKRYIDLYYDNYILNDKITRTLDITQPIPSREEFHSDQYRQGDPKTPYLKELKRVVRERYGPKTSLKDVPDLDPRPMISLKLQDSLTPEDYQQLKEEILHKVTPVLNDKDLYMTDQPRSSVPIKFFDAKVYTIEDIKTISLDISATDPCFKIVAITQKETEFPCVLRLRWGKGIGFSNVRADIRIE